MKIIRFVISLIITLGIITALNMKLGSIPPLGKFLDPFQGFWACGQADPEIENEIVFDDLKSNVQIRYDDMLVPHIFANNDEDIYFATGYVHAYHRLWQMEFQTHVAAGRLSEIVGKITLDMDRGMRRKGMVFGAENFINGLDDQSKSIIQQYTRGVNAYINGLSYKDFPFEYKLLDYQPENWTPVKSGLLYKYMSDMLNSGERDFENTNFLNLYGREMLDLIYPDVANYNDPVVDKDSIWDFDPVSKDSTIGIPSKNLISKIDLIDKPNPNNGSNNWAVSPKKSATGHALLCNDMHLSLYLPSLWFYIQQNTNELNVYGHSLPGIPFVITGFTDSIAWGFTNAQRDLVDWYKIEYQDEHKGKYMLDGQFVAFDKRIEEIKVRGTETYYDTVDYTIFGPVMYDHTYRAGSEKNGYARRWIDHDPSGGFNMFYRINRAKNYEDYMEALDHFTSPAQNIAFASVQGNIAMRIQGKYPVNSWEEGKFVKDGSISTANWTTYIPNAHNASEKNPERGFVASANQHPTDAAYPYYITSRQFEAYRNRRINQVLQQDSSITVEDMKHLQYDNFSLKAAESLPWMLKQLYGAPLTAVEMEISESLKNWDFIFNANAKAPVLYDLWFENLAEAAWDEISLSRENNVSLVYPTDYTTIKLLKENPDLEFFDIKTTAQKENAKELAILAFHAMIEELRDLESKQINLTWATYKSTFVGHQLRIQALGVYGLNVGGGSGDIVNATGKNHGPSERIIVELDPEGVKAWGHYPGGQSGNPGSKYFDNMIDAWANGQYYNLLLMKNPDDARERILISQTLKTSR